MPIVNSSRCSALCCLACGSLTLLAGCGGLLPDQKAASASPFESYDQVVEAFDQIVPGMTHAEDLPNLGFDARTGNVEVLSYLNIEERFLPAAGVRWEHLNPAVQACIRAEVLLHRLCLPSQPHQLQTHGRPGARCAGL